MGLSAKKSEHNFIGPVPGDETGGSVPEQTQPWQGGEEDAGQQSEVTGATGAPPGPAPSLAFVTLFLQVQLWFEARRSNKEQEEDDTMQEIKEFINKASPVKSTAPSKKSITPSKKSPGVVASKADVEVVDILDDSMDESDEPSLVESPMMRSKKSKEHEVKLTMAGSGAKEVKESGGKSRGKEVQEVKPTRALPKAPVKVVDEEPTACPTKKNELMEELMTRIDQLEKELRAKDKALYKTKKELDIKVDVEKTLAEKEKALKIVEANMPNLLAEHKKSMARKDEDIAKLKTAKEALEKDVKDKKGLSTDLEVQKKKKEASDHEISELKSKVEEIKLMKNEEIKAVKADLKDNLRLKDGELKDLKLEMKKIVASKDEENKALKSDLKNSKDVDKKSLEEEWKKELKVKDEEMKKKLQVKDNEWKTKLEVKSEDIKNKLDKKDNEVKEKLMAKDDKLKEKLAVKDEEQKKALKLNKEEHETKLEELKNKLDQKAEEVLRANAELNSKDQELKGLKVGQEARKELEVRLKEAEGRVEQGRREVLDLKAYQRKLETKMSTTEEEVFFAKAEVHTQGVIRAGMVAKLKEKEQEVEDKEAMVARLQGENKEHLEKISRLQSEKEIAQEAKEAAETKVREIDLEMKAVKESANKDKMAMAEAEKAKVLDLEAELEAAKVELEAARLNLSTSSCPYAVNTPRRRIRSNTHRLDTEAGGEEDMEDMEEEQEVVVEIQEVGSSIPGKRPLPFAQSEAEPDFKKIRLCSEEEEVVRIVVQEVVDHVVREQEVVLDLAKEQQVLEDVKEQLKLGEVAKEQQVVEGEASNRETFKDELVATEEVHQKDASKVEIANEDVVKEPESFELEVLTEQKEEASEVKTADNKEQTEVKEAGPEKVKKESSEEEVQVGEQVAAQVQVQQVGMVTEVEELSKEGRTEFLASKAETDSPKIVVEVEQAKMEVVEKESTEEQDASKTDIKTQAEPSRESLVKN